TQTHTHNQTLRYTHIHAGTHICKPISTHAHSTPSSSTHTPIHTCTQITDPHVSTHKNTSKHTCTCTHAHTHTYMHIHTFIHTHFPGTDACPMFLTPAFAYRCSKVGVWLPSFM